MMLSPPLVEACNIPVFRYALERWQPDPYRVTLLYSEPLGDVEQQVVATLDKQMASDQPPYLFRRVDVRGPLSAEDKKLSASLGALALPALLVQYPEGSGLEEPFWHGACTATNVAALLTSPVRQELYQRLMRGDSIVWLFLESGDKVQDDRVAALLESESRLLELDIKLPELTDAPEDKLSKGTPLRLAFSVLRVPRTAAEQLLVEMLLGIRPAKTEKAEALVFPVFGRGRALDALPAKKIQTDTIREYAGFLTAACSCRVKELNPGTDLLLGADWEQLFTAAEIESSAARKTPEKVVPDIVPIPAGVSSTSPATNDTPPPTMTHAASEDNPRSWMPFAIVGLSVLGLAGIGIRMSRYRNRRLGPSP